MFVVIEKMWRGRDCPLFRKLLALHSRLLPCWPKLVAGLLESFHGQPADTLASYFNKKYI